MLVPRNGGDETNERKPWPELTHVVLNVIEVGADNDTMTRHYTTITFDRRQMTKFDNNSAIANRHG